MKYKLICFDLQGTLSNSEFSDHFWLEILPALYQNVKGVATLNEAKKQLGQIFSLYGKYDCRYYSLKYWIKELNLTVTEGELISRISVPQIVYSDTLRLVEDLSVHAKVIVLSTTVRSFIAKELDRYGGVFTNTYSAIDDFATAGKTGELYKRIARLYNIEPREAINIGDNVEMDIVNAKAAGWDTFLLNKQTPRAEVTRALRVKLKDNL